MIIRSEVGVLVVAKGGGGIGVTEGSKGRCMCEISCVFFCSLRKIVRDVEFDGLHVGYWWERREWIERIVLLLLSWRGCRLVRVLKVLGKVASDYFRGNFLRLGLGDRL